MEQANMRGSTSCANEDINDYDVEKLEDRYSQIERDGRTINNVKHKKRIRSRKKKQGSANQRTPTMNSNQRIVQSSNNSAQATHN